MRLYLTLFVISISGMVHAQSGSDPGEISTPATLPNPMDPNGDGWITSTGKVFTGPLDETEFELPYVPLPAYGPEPVGDVQVSSTSCTMYDLSAPTSGAESTYYYYLDPDGIPDDGDELVFFRFRVGRLHTNSVTLSILIDTDHTFGFAPSPDADLNAVVGNPGFELEVAFEYTDGTDIMVYDVDGVAGSSVLLASYPTTTNLQASYALNQDPACGSRKPGFIDIYLPLSSLGISSADQIRIVSAASEQLGSLLGGVADDIGGINGNGIADDDQFAMVIGSYPPFTLGSGTNRAPSGMNATVSISENSPNGTAAHTVSTSDPDGDAMTYTITGGNTATAFVINSAGQITVNNTSALDFESTPSFKLTVRVSDGTLSDDATITINLNDVNEPPTAQDATVSVNENLPLGTVVHTVATSDPEGDMLSYSIILGTPFAINNLGEITIYDMAGLDYETTSSFILTVIVFDEGGNSEDAVITINLNNVNETPSASDATVSLDEHSANGTALHTVVASDPDGDALTYSIIGGNTGTAFAIDGSGEITVDNASALDFEVTPSFTLTIRASDGALFDDATIMVNLNEVNDAPVAGDATVLLNENSANATAVYSVVASDPDGDALTYAITAGNTGTAFAINASGQITVTSTSALDFETTPSFALTVRVSDGTLFDDAVVTVNLNDINETPTAADAAVLLNENSANGTPVHTMSATDADGDALTYTITAGNIASAFAINGSGQITVNNSSALDFETTPNFTLTVRASDESLFDDAFITINLNDLDETPPDINNAPIVNDAIVSINENSVNGTAVHPVSATDPDGDALTYVIIGGDVEQAFTISSTTGQITVNDAAALDFENISSFTLTVRVSDETSFDDAVITVNLTNVNEPPSASDATVFIDENSATGTVVHALTPFDPEGSVLTYTIIDGNTADAFEVSNIGMISVHNTSSLDYETTPSFAIIISVSDGTLSDDAVVIIHLNDLDDLNDAPTVSDAIVSLDENSPYGTVVHTLSASDPDGDALTYTITSGNDDNGLTISNTGVISVTNSAAFDFERLPTTSITVRVSDGQLFSEASITVNLVDMNEPPAVTDAVIKIRDDIANGSIIHQVVADDPDTNDAALFSIESGNTGTAFLINAYSGEVIVNNIQPLDEGQSRTYDLLVMVTDAGGLTATATLTIEIESVDEEIGITPVKAFSPNGDGINDFWLIRGIEAFPDNEVKVFNRWGVIVYEARHYNNQDTAWRGERSGRLGGGNLPETTYYFLIRANGLEPISGYVIMK